MLTISMPSCSAMNRPSDTARAVAAEAVSALLTESGSLDTVWPRFQARLCDERETALPL